MTEEEKNQEKFEGLSLNSQMRVLRSKKNLQQIMSNTEDMFENFEAWDATIKVVKNCDDRNIILAVLFSFAEWSEKRKPSHDGDDMSIERAKEADWLRHIYSEQGIKAMRNACHIIEAVTMGDFEQAKSLAIENNLVSKEYKRIYNYWYNALNM